MFTEELFSTAHDEGNRAAVKMSNSSNLNLVGLAIRADKRVVDKIVKGLSLHS
ncbi:DUF2000 family protein [Pelosinus baikalensis]|uniref:DUF2000 domain-containing protein n=1 Tax=Pelosinus baikalensis TaxID=2892015 RepID=A0ABS8HQ91_9FIRM|nr:DUF2000 domain-containing protein [Pelosinus baikalensis]